MNFKRIRKSAALVLSAVLAASAVPFSGITASAVDTDLSGNTLLQSDEITLGKLVSGAITENDDDDWYKFTLSEPSKISVAYGADSAMFWSHVYMYDGTNDNSLIYEQTLKNTKNINAIFYLTAGDYYFCVHGGSNGDRAKYDLKIAADSSSLNVPGDGSNNAIGDAAEIELETKYNAQISLNDDIDYYTFDLEKEGSVTFDFAGGLNAVDWTLYDNKDDLIKHGIYQKNDEKDSRITKKNNLILKPGKYTVAVGANEKAASYGQYTFSFNYVEKYNDTAANGIIAAADLNRDGTINSIDASIILVYYSYCATGGKETDMNKWIEENYNIKK